MPKVPEGERDPVHHILQLVIALQSYTHAFESALALKEWCDAQSRELLDKRAAANAASPTGSVVNPHIVGPDPTMAGEPDPNFWIMTSRFADWTLIAGRDAAMTIYHFGVVASAIKRQVGFAPSLSADTEAIGAAEDLFRRKFPKAKRLRHAVGHAAEAIRTKEIIETHSVGRTFISDSMDGDIFHATFKAKGAEKAETLSVAITRQTLDQLNDIETRMLTAFK